MSAKARVRDNAAPMHDLARALYDALELAEERMRWLSGIGYAIDLACNAEHPQLDRIADLAGIACWLGDDGSESAHAVMRDARRAIYPNAQGGDA